MSTIKTSLEDSVPFLRISGEPEDMGRLHGQKFARKIRNLYDDRLTILLESNKALLREDVKDFALILWDTVCKFDHQIAVEVEATAQASNLQPWQMVVAGGYTDLLDLLSPSNKGKHHECTIAINPSAGFLAGTWDSHPSAVDALILLQRDPIGGPSTLALTTAGWPCQQGINSFGVGFAITNLTPKKINKSGLVYIAANAALGSAKSVDEISQRLKSERYCSGHSYVLIETSGNSAIVETTGIDVDVKWINQLTTKANHYRSGSDAIDDNSNYDFFESSRMREKELLVNISGVTDPHAFTKSLLQCLAVNRRDPTGPAVTCARYFISLYQKSLWYAKGPVTSMSVLHPMSVRRLL